MHEGPIWPTDYSNNKSAITLPIGRQTIIWTDDNRDHRRINASLGFSELSVALVPNLGDITNAPRADCAYMRHALYHVIMGGLPTLEVTCAPLVAGAGQEGNSSWPTAIFIYASRFSMLIPPAPKYASLISVLISPVPHIWGGVTNGSLLPSSPNGDFTGIGSAYRPDLTSFWPIAVQESSRHEVTRNKVG